MRFLESSLVRALYQIAKTWSDVIPGDEEKKKSGVKKLLTDWNKKYKPEDSVTKDAFLARTRRVAQKTHRKTLARERERERERERVKRDTHSFETRG